MNDVAEKLRATIRALDKVCSACLAAFDEATWNLLHRGRSCPNKKTDGKP